MTEVWTDEDAVRDALRRLNPEAHEADYSWHALNRIVERLREALEISRAGVDLLRQWNEEDFVPATSEEMDKGLHGAMVQAAFDSLCPRPPCPCPGACHEHGCQGARANRLGAS